MITAFLIFFALILEYIYDPVSNMKDTAVVDKFFMKFRDLIKNYKFEKIIIYLSFPIFIFVIVNMLDYALYNFLHPFFSFLLSLIILLYCLKPNEFSQKLDNLKFAIQSETDQEQSDRFRYILHANKNDEIDSIVNNIFYNSMRSIFSILFIFLLLGPAGCLGYIIIDNYIYSKQIKVDQKSKKFIKLVVSILEFLPIRICAFTFAVVANFELCLDKWRSLKHHKEIYNSNSNLINTIGLASFKGDDDNLALAKVIYAQSIISRSLLAWLSVIGLLVISGVII